MAIFTKKKYLAVMLKITTMVMLKAVILLLLLVAHGGVEAQTSQVVFGKNRVQYHRDFDAWMKYESDNFVTYWYGEGRNIAQAVVQMAETEFPYVQRILEHRMNEKVQIIVYVDLTDLKQSNLGSDEIFTNAAGRTKFLGNKVFVYFNGDHNDLRRQVREGIAGVYLEAMLYGSGLQEIVQNAILMNLPDWFTTGLTAFVGEKWNTRLDDELRQLLLSGRYSSFEALAKEHPVIAGHSFWYYIYSAQGLSTVSYLLYVTRINRSLDEGFMYSLGKTYGIIAHDWYAFFGNRYALDMRMREEVGGREVPVRNRKRLPVTAMEISPDGRRLAYVVNEIGRYKVYLTDLGSMERKRIFRYGFRNNVQSPDYNYPLLAWNPNGQELAIMYEHRDKGQLLRYGVRTGERVVEPLASDYQRVNSMSYLNPSVLALSATVRGFSDIFLYFPATRQSQRITADPWDDLGAVAVNLRNRPGLIFASNRPDTLLQASTRLDSLLPLQQFDLFYYNLEGRPGTLVRLTNSPEVSETGAVAVDSSHFYYLSDDAGISNRVLGRFEEYIHAYEQLVVLKDGTRLQLPLDSLWTTGDSSLVQEVSLVPVMRERAVSYPITNYRVNIRQQSTAIGGDRLAQLWQDSTLAYRIRLAPMSRDSSLALRLVPTVFRRLRAQTAATTAGAPANAAVQAPAAAVSDTAQGLVIPVREKEPVDSLETISIDSYLFQSRFEDEPAVAEEGAVAEQTFNQSSPSLAQLVQSPFYRQVNAGNYVFQQGNIIPYREAFQTDFVSFNMDNNLLFEGLDSYAASSDGFNFQPLGVLLKANFKDLLEDYVIEGGMRVPTSFNGTEYYVTGQKRKHRLDQIYSVYRRNMRFAESGAAFVPWRRETNVLLGQAGVRYPLDIFRSVRATATVRRDRVQYVGTDNFALDNPIVREQRVGLRLEYVFDNSIDLAMNLRQGTRYKMWIEAYKSFAFGNGDGLSFAPGYLGVVSADMRHYQRLDKRSILALRLAGAASFGQQRILYYLGDTDNSLIPSFNTSIPVGDENNRLTALANSMRGFSSNARNGNSYLLFNSELRVPVFRYLSERIRSPFLRNFQLVGFFDIGTAWSGPDPYSDENPLNTATFPDPTEVTTPPVQIRVVYFRNPIIAGYGVGARALLFGYFMRVDYAWGIETKTIQQPRLHLSLGMDF